MIIADTGFWVAIFNHKDTFAEVLGHGRILSTDSRDFQTYRWKNRYPFENLLLQDA